MANKRSSEETSNNPHAREWGVLLKARSAVDRPPASEQQLRNVLARLPGEDKKLTGGGRDFTVAFWVDSSNAAEAASLAVSTLRVIAGSEGVAHLNFIRIHAASIEGRSPHFTDLDEHVEFENEWAVDVKSASPNGVEAASTQTLTAVREAIGLPAATVTFQGDKEKFLLDDGSGFTARFWATGSNPPGAFESAGERMQNALRQVGLPGWTFVRFKAWNARHLKADGFPGAQARSPQNTGELR